MNIKGVPGNFGRNMPSLSDIYKCKTSLIWVFQIVKYFGGPEKGRIGADKSWFYKWLICTLGMFITKTFRQ